MRNKNLLPKTCPIEEKHFPIQNTLNRSSWPSILFSWNKGCEFSSFLPQDKEEDFKTVILEGLEMAKHQVRVDF